MKSNLNSLFFVLLLLFSIENTFAQKTKAQLEKEKKENLKKIQEASKVLEQTQVEAKATIGQLNAINEKVRAQQSLINTIKKEMDLMDRDINDNQVLIQSLASDLEKMKLEYEKMIYEASKNNNEYNKLLFIFSSKTLYDIYLRYKFLEQYAEARRKQAEQIIKVNEELVNQNELLISKRKEKQELLNSQLVESQNLVSLRKQKDGILQELTSRQKEIKAELKEREKAIARLEKLIEDLLKAEIAKKTKKGDSKMTLTPEAKVISASFTDNKGRLIWPVEYGFISHKFGKNPHPDIPGVIVDNLGVDFQTQKGSKVRAVFDGVVSAVAVVPGMQNVIMIQHGEYFTVYAKVDNVQVKMGQKITRKDILGTVHTKSNGVSEVQFQVWKTNNKLNPEHWIFKK